MVRTALAALLSLMVAPVYSQDSLQSYLDQKDYFRLAVALDQEASHMDPLDRAYYQVFTDNAFARNTWSIREARALLSRGRLTTARRLALWLVQEDNYCKMGWYADAAACCDTLLGSFGDLLDSDHLAEVTNDQSLWTSLAGVPPLEVSVPGTVSIHWTRDRAGLMEVPIRKDSTLYDFVFDTGAGLSTIGESFADELKLKRLPGTLLVNGSTGAQNLSSLAVADTLYLGTVLLRNVVFLVLPDSELTFSPINFSIKAILGLPVIAQLGEVHILQEGLLTLEPEARPNPCNLKPVGWWSNLALNGWSPIVSVVVEGDTLSFHFDTGASGTELYPTYLARHRGRVLREGVAAKSQRGGAGGIVQSDVYRLKNLGMEVAGRRIMLHKVDVLSDATASRGDAFYGSLGQDVIGKFPEMVLDFKHMYVAFP